MSELEIRERIAKVRKNKDMSYQDLADITGISPSTLQRYETGNIDKMPITKLELIAKALGVEPAYLMGWEEDTHEPIQEYDPDAIEVLQMLERDHELKMLFMKTGKLSKEDKERLVRILKATLPENSND
ncbi:MAG: XRE family transcriptional regulator [Fusobacteria bacterium]|nr:MAG: XRE family transcriptional regulator [Fusobacteriota bacterium]KAF0228940.1 MAG: XRE family transcriptional [Fusobacteriota bacterium]